MTIRTLALGLALVMTAAATHAQPPQRGQRGQGGGPGGGGMMMAGANLGQLVQSKTVRDELKLTEDQVGKLKEWAEAQPAKMREVFQNAGGDRDAMREKFAEIQKTASKEVGEILKPEQAKRLKQIEFQMAGVRGLMSPDAQKSLDITEDQKEKLQSAMTDMGKDMRELAEEYGVRGFGGRPADADKAKEFEKKSAQLTKDATSQVMKLMTDEQKKKYAELSGEPIDVAKVRSETMRTVVVAAGGTTKRVFGGGGRPADGTFTRRTLARQLGGHARPCVVVSQPQR